MQFSHAVVLAFIAAVANGYEYPLDRRSADAYADAEPYDAADLQARWAEPEAEPFLGLHNPFRRKNKNAAFQDPSMSAGMGGMDASGMPPSEQMMMRRWASPDVAPGPDAAMGMGMGPGVGMGPGAGMGPGMDGGMPPAHTIHKKGKKHRKHRKHHKYHKQHAATQGAGAPGSDAAGGMGGMPPSAGGMPPSAGGMPPSAGGMAPSAGGMAPSAGGAPPPAGGMDPSAGGMPSDPMGGSSAGAGPNVGAPAMKRWAQPEPQIDPSMSPDMSGMGGMGSMGGDSMYAAPHKTHNPFKKIKQKIKNHRAKKAAQASGMGDPMGGMDPSMGMPPSAMSGGLGAAGPDVGAGGMMRRWAEANAQGAVAGGRPHPKGHHSHHSKKYWQMVAAKRRQRKNSAAAQAPPSAAAAPPSAAAAGAMGAEAGAPPMMKRWASPEADAAADFDDEYSHLYAREAEAEADMDLYERDAEPEADFDGLYERDADPEAEFEDIFERDADPEADADAEFDGLYERDADPEADAEADAGLAERDLDELYSFMY